MTLFDLWNIIHNAYDPKHSVLKLSRTFMHGNTEKLNYQLFNVIGVTSRRLSKFYSRRVLVSSMEHISNINANFILF
jgi:hypothetical protein